MNRSDGLARVSTPVQRRGIESSARVMASARALLDRRRVANVRMADISRASGVSIGSISFHFGAKENLLRQVMARGLKDLAASVERAAPGWQDRADTAGVIDAAMISLSAAFSQSAGLLRAVDECLPDMPDCGADMAEVLRGIANRVGDALRETAPTANAGDVAFVSALMVDILRDRARLPTPIGAQVGRGQLVALFNAYLVREHGGMPPVGTGKDGNFRG